MNSTFLISTNKLYLLSQSNVKISMYTLKNKMLQLNELSKIIRHASLLSSNGMSFVQIFCITCPFRVCNRFVHNVDNQLYIFSRGISVCLAAMYRLSQSVAMFQMMSIILHRTRQCQQIIATSCKHLIRRNKHISLFMATAHYLC